MRRTHWVPVFSGYCEGADCRACPRLWRYFVTGMELWGRGDNASFWDDATEDYRRKPKEKLTRARWRRVLRRWLFVGLPLLIGLASWIYSAWLIKGYVLALLAFGATAGARAIAPWWATREVRKNYLYPAMRTLGKVTGTRLRKRDAPSIIELPPGFGEEIEGEPEPVRVYVPEVVLDAGMKKRIANAVGARLGLPEPIAKWTESGVPVAYVDLLPQALPPKSVTLEDVMEELLAGDIDHPLVGVMTGGRVSRMDMKNDSPHTLGSAGTGAGKSSLYKFVGMQRMRLGAYAIIVDFKKWSHLRWAGRLPSDRVLIEDEIPAIHNVLGRILDELLWRKSFVLEQEDELLRLPKVDVYVEEINTLMDMLVTYWRGEVARRKQAARTRLRRAKEAAKMGGDGEEVPDAYLAEIDEAEEELAQAMGLPITSPAIQALRYGVNLGREFGIHFHFIGQSVSAKAAGGRDTRESFRTRLLARWDLKTWKMLADGLPFIACPSTEPGVWAHVHAGRAEIVRVPLVPDEFAVEYVLGGVRPSGPMFHDDPVTSIEEDERPSLPSVAKLSDLVNLLPHKADGDRMTLKALQIAAGRPGFPDRFSEPEPGKATLYRTDEVLAWFRDREGIPALDR